MLIVKGNVETRTGPVAIENLKVGDLVVDQRHRTRQVLSITKLETERTMAFARNSSLKVSADALLYTLYGERTASDLTKDNVVYMQQPNARIVKDYIHFAEEKCEGYAITVKDGSSIVVDGYCIGL